MIGYMAEREVPQELRVHSTDEEKKGWSESPLETVKPTLCAQVPVDSSAAAPAPHAQHQGEVNGVILRSGRPGRRRLHLSVAVVPLGSCCWALVFQNRDQLYNTAAFSPLWGFCRVQATP